LKINFELSWSEYNRGIRRKGLKIRVWNVGLVLGSRHIHVIQRRSRCSVGLVVVVVASSHIHAIQRIGCRIPIA